MEIIVGLVWINGVSIHRDISGEFRYRLDCMNTKYLEGND